MRTTTYGRSEKFTTGHGNCVVTHRKQRFSVPFRLSTLDCRPLSDTDKIKLVYNSGTIHEKTVRVIQKVCMRACVWTCMYR